MDSTPAAVPATVERLLSPAHVVDLLQDATLEELAAFFAQARDMGSRAWMAMAVCVGLAQERSTYGDDALGQLSQLFGLHRSRIARLGRIYRELLRERITHEGDAATFVLSEQSWYEVAVEAAPIVRRSPDELLADAEARKLDDSRYSIRRWKDDLGLDGDDSLDGEAKRVLGLLVKIASMPDDVIEAIHRTSGPDTLATIRTAHAALHRLDTGEDLTSNARPATDGVG